MEVLGVRHRLAVGPEGPGKGQRGAMMSGRDELRNLFCPRCSHKASGILVVFQEGSEWWCGNCVNSWSTDAAKAEADLAARRAEQAEEWEAIEMERMKEEAHRQLAEDQETAEEREVWAQCSPADGPGSPDEAAARKGWGRRDWAAEAVAEHHGGPLGEAEPEVCEDNRCDPCRLPGGWWCRGCDKPLRLVRPLYRPDREEDGRVCGKHPDEEGDCRWCGPEPEPVCDTHPAAEGKCEWCDSRAWGPSQPPPDDDDAEYQRGYDDGHEAGRILATNEGFSDAWDYGWKACLKWLRKEGRLKGGDDDGA